MPGIHVLGEALTVVMTALLIFFLVVNTFRAVLLLCSVPELWSHWHLADDQYFRTLIGTDAFPSISLITTASNAGASIVGRVRALLALEYPRFEVVVVNDGSADETLVALIRAFGLTQVSPAFTVSIPTEVVRGYYRSPAHPRLLVVDKVAGGVGDALNAGLNAARYPYALVTIGKIVVEGDALLRLTRPFLLNKEVAAVAAPIGVADGGELVDGRFVPVVSREFAIGSQTVELLRTGVFERLGWNRVASNLCFPSSAALVLREHLLAIRGFRRDVESLQADLMVRLQRYLTDRGIDAAMLVIPDAVVWTEFGGAAGEWGDVEVRAGVETRAGGGLGESGGGGFADALRAEGGHGVLPVLLEHRDICLNPEYGALGMLALPYYWIGNVAAPFLELLGYVGLIIGSVLGVLPSGFVLVYLATVLGYGMLLSVWTVILEAFTDSRYASRGDFVRLFVYALLKPFGYRQMTAWLRVRALFTLRSAHRLPHHPYESHAPSRSA